MIIGIPTEIKEEELRVAATPATVFQITQAGHTVLIQAGAGAGISATDEEYIHSGAEIIQTAEELWERAEMIYKVKEPLESEYKYLREGLIVFCYLHMANNEPLLNALIENKVISIAYETIEVDKTLPLLKPMSEIGGCMAIVEGSNLLKHSQGGKGRLLQGVPGVPPGHVVVIGSGTAGRGAIRTAVGIGARVTAIDRNIDKLSALQDIYGPRLETQFSSPYNISKAVKTADLVVGAVLVTGARTPKVVTEEMVKSMEPGSVIVDIAVDQGGCVETIDRFTTHSDPVYIRHGVLHYAVPNIPGTVAATATTALSNATSRYAIEIANQGWIQASDNNPAIKKGINTAYGKITYKGVAEAFDKEYVDLDNIIHRILKH